jgi:hypothetical protein
VSVLTKEDFATPTWLRLKEHCEARIAELRLSNDKSLGVDETARLRGRIAEVKSLLALDQPAKLLVAPVP